VPTYSYSTVTATLAASTAYTAIEIKPPTGGITVLKWWVELNSVTATDKQVLVQMGAFSAAVTTLTAVTAANVPKVDYGMNGLVAQSVVGFNASSEGAGTFVAGGEQHSIPPNSGMSFWETEDTAFDFPSAINSVRIRLTPGAALTATTATCGITWRE
jgi:hypothetical protein